MVAQDIGQLLNFISIYDVKRTELLRGVHAHVEWTVVAIGKPTIRFVELRRRNAQVEQSARNLWHIVHVQELGHAVEASLMKHQSAIKAWRNFPCMLNGHWILVNAEHAHPRVRSEQSHCVACPTQRCVHDHTMWNRTEEFSDFIGHHWLMIER